RTADRSPSGGSVNAVRHPAPFSTILSPLRRSFGRRRRGRIAGANPGQVGLWRPRFRRLLPCRRPRRRGADPLPTRRLRPARQLLLRPGLRLFADPAGFAGLPDRGAALAAAELGGAGLDPVAGLAAGPRPAAAGRGGPDAGGAAAGDVLLG